MSLIIYTNRKDIPSDVRYIHSNDTFFNSVSLKNSATTEKILKDIDKAQYSDIVQVIAYATQERFNDTLKDVLDTKFSNGYKRLRHLSSVGLNSIW